MLHYHRQFNVAQVLTVSVLAENLTQNVWTLCTGFEYTHFHKGARRTFYFLNDALDENSATEFAVYENGCQIESWTTNWMSEKEVINDFFPALLKKKPTTGAPLGVMPSIVHNDGTCRLCA